MDYSNLCLIFWGYWHVSFWITQKKALNKLIFSEYWHVPKNGVLSHYRMKMKKIPSTEMPIQLSTCNFYLLPQTNTSTPHTHYLQLVSSMVRLVSILYFTWTRSAKECLHSAMLKYSISTRLTISVTRCRIFRHAHSSNDSCRAREKKP